MQPLFDAVPPGYMTETSQDFARRIRVETLKMVTAAKASHIGGAFSMTDLLAVLYDGTPPR